MPKAAGFHYFLYNEKDEDRLPAILIHGAGGSHLSWPPHMRRMKGQRIFAVDLPGHGKSDGAGRQSISGYAADMLAFMDALNLSSAAFVGHSMGAAIALALTLQHPNRVRGLCLIGGGAKLRVSPAILDLTSRADTFASAVNLIVDNSFSEHAPPRLKELAAQRMLETPPPVLHGDFLASDGFNMMEDLPRIKTRTLILCGGEDKMTPPKYSEFLRDSIPGAALEIIPNAGHMLMLEKPDQVTRSLEKFLDPLHR